MWTRSVTGAKFTIVDQDDKSAPMIDGKEAKHTGKDDLTARPTETKITRETEKIVGPRKIKVKVDSISSRMSLEKYLVAFCVYPN